MNGFWRLKGLANEDSHTKCMVCYLYLNEAIVEKGYHSKTMGELVCPLYINLHAHEETMKFFTKSCHKLGLFFP